MRRLFTGFLSIVAGLLWITVTFFGFMDSLHLPLILLLCSLPVAVGVFAVFHSIPFVNKRFSYSNKTFTILYLVSWAIAVGTPTVLAHNNKKISTAAMKAECACNPAIQQNQECNPPGGSIIVTQNYQDFTADCIKIYEKEFFDEPYFSPPAPQTNYTPVQTSVGAWCICSDWARTHSPFCKKDDHEKLVIRIQPVSNSEAVCLVTNAPLYIPWRSVSRKDHCNCIEELKSDSYCTGTRDTFEKPVYLTKTQKQCLESRSRQ